MRSKTDILNRLIELESFRNIDGATDFVLELADAEVGAAGQALGELFARGTPRQMSFAAMLFSPLQDPRGRLDPADLIAGLERADRPTSEEFGAAAVTALLTQLLRTSDRASATRVRDLRLPGGLLALASIFLRLDPPTFWARFDEWPANRLHLVVANVLPSLDRAALDALAADLDAHRDKFGDPTWQAIQEKLDWRRQTLKTP
jgi:hypothetical protein